MYEYELKNLKLAISRYAKKKHSSSEISICVFGVSERTHHIIRELALKDIKVKYVLDNDEKKQKMYCCGVPVVPINRIKDEPEVDIFIMSVFWREMEKQLLDIGILKKHIFIIKLAKEIEATFFEKILYVLMGRNIFLKIKKKYSENVKILLCPYTGTGDIYLIGTLLQQYIVQELIEDYVLVVVSAACRRVAELFGIEKIEKLSSTDDCSKLISYYMVVPEECDIKILNDSFGDIYTNPTQWIRGYKGHNFTEMFRKYVFGLPDDAMPQSPCLKEVNSVIDSLFAKHKLEKGKTVILSPYATTLADMPDGFWEELADKLKGMGYIVCTNSSGEKEPAVKGTQAVFFSLNIAPQVIEAAGAFIGVRSGFCDVISCAKAKKIILYDRNNWFYNCSAYEYFSLKKMGLCDDAVEFEFDNYEQDSILKLTEDILKEIVE